jgi:predicted nucleic acid-binding protein
VDASVAVKWFVEEPDSDAAGRLLSDYVEGAVDLYSSQMLTFEVLNALRYNPEMGLDQLRTVAKALEAMELMLHPLSGEYAERTLVNAMNHGITVYDSSYVSLGEEQGIQVYTADRRLMSRVSSGRLAHISEYSERVVSNQP